MQAEKLCSYLIIVKLLTSLRSLKHSKDSLDILFVIYVICNSFIIALYVFSLKWSAIIVHLTRVFTVFRAVLLQQNQSHTRKQSGLLLTIPVQAIHYIICSCVIYIVVSILNYMCLYWISYYWISLTYIMGVPFSLWF